MAASLFSRAPLPWKPLAGRALELALNQLLALDPDTRDAIRRLDGRHVVVRLAAPELALRLDVDGDRLRVGPVTGDDDADLSVRGTLAGLLAQLPLLQRSGAGGTGRVRIEGDADLARQLQRLARGFDPDWQAPFVRLFGEVAGVQIAGLFAGALRQAEVVGRNLAESTAEFLTEESRDLVGRNELDAFLDDVDAVRDGVERMDARVRRLRTLAAERGIAMPEAGR
ncbi:SCP2 domain-containing protein [Luteimonas yindakuii]|uniref:Ubiquinone biosynthesis accessory factor UbiJ n=1 Tax=Luteimonas yindakuii TaxID=2565782 RepID=A0A4Z1R904_9GAMM|nr:SCP2 sterol-binding domain-containing protein [Luteimonas yindakuii]TKS53148.1 SCP2 domain-containing protein [Luteimonas yindakuii]